MKFTTLFYAVKARSANVLKRHPLLHLATVPLLGALVIPIIAWAQAQPLGVPVELEVIFEVSA